MNQRCPRRKSTVEQFVSLMILLGALLGATLPMHAQSDAESMDIVGLKLGMTQSEALAALKAHDAALVFAEEESFFNYTDGVSYFQTEPFLSKIVASDPGSAQAIGSILLYFTPPPNGGKLWAIDRKEEIKDSQPTLEQYTEALVKKYGPPLATSREGYALTWDFPKGSTTCLLRPPNDPAFPQFRPRNNNSGDLMSALRAGQQGKRVPDDLSVCGSQLYYLLGTTNGQVINNFHAILIDVAGYATAEEAAGDHVAKLEESAVQARTGKGQAPKL